MGIFYIRNIYLVSMGLHIDVSKNFMNNTEESFSETLNPVY